MQHRAADRNIENIRIDAVYFAQTHVQRPEDDLFRLVAGRSALIKVHVVSPVGAEAPAVRATLKLHEKTRTVPLSGPATLPVSVPTEPGVVIHRFADCFTAMIPAQWIQRGLEVAVTAGSARCEITALRVGAPTHVHMTMIDMHFFDYEDADYPEGWQDLILEQWPAAKLTVERVRGTVLKELIVPPRAGLPAIRCTSTEDYARQAGTHFDGKQGAAKQWMRALQDAGGQYGLSYFYINIGNVKAGGEAWDFSGVGKLGKIGTLHHESGHAFGVLHLMDELDYPYVGDLHGIAGTTQHHGPTWGFDRRIGLPGAPDGQAYFIPPTVQEGASGGVPGEWKHDPMQGGMNDADPGHPLRNFSDWTVHKMQAYLEQKVTVWNEDLQAYATWNDETGTYATVRANDAAVLPIERDVDVFSIMACASAVTPDGNFIYPPVGPYRSGLIRLFDPSVQEDRAAAGAAFADKGRCDVTLRIVQGGRTITAMLPMEWRPDDDPTTPWLFQTRAVNLPARDGKVTRAELLLTPDAVHNGLPTNPVVLHECS